MCGIVGFYAREGISSEVLERMATSVRHRGPDDEGFFGVGVDGKILHWKKPGEVRADLHVGMAFRRLAILDLSPHGAQPMATADRRHWICFNGEIYNYVELRERMLGQSFSSTGDTQVLLSLLSSRGVEAVNELNGIFAISLYDTQAERLTLIRDPLGIKPLYYEDRKEGLFFGSEVRALRASSPHAPRLNLPLVSRFLMSNWIPDPDTLFEGIYRLEPGSLLEIGPDVRPQKTRYWDFGFKPRVLGALEWEERLEAALKGAVDRQLRSDVPVAFFLSGGVDSSLLTASAVRARREQMTAYTVGFSWSKNADDRIDLESSRLLARELKLDHHELILSPDVLGVFPKVIDSLEEPISDPAALCSYLICEAASPRYRVLISGQGADELFGGYGLYQNALLTRRAQGMPQGLLAGFEAGAELLPYSIAGRPQQRVHRLQKFLRLAQRPWPEALFLLRSSLGPEDPAQLLTNETLRAQADPFGRHRELLAKVAGGTAGEQALYLDTKAYLSALNLFYSDKTSMAHSIELRVPFLDRELVELAETLPLEEKFDRRRSKILLKRVAARILPREIVHRKKTGFGLPVRDWLRKDLRPLAQELLDPALLREQALFNPELVQGWMNEHARGTRDHSARLFLLMSFQMWMRTSGVRR